MAHLVYPGCVLKELRETITYPYEPRSQSAPCGDKIDRLTSQPSQSLKLTIDDFEDREAMLRDVRARISYLKRDLGALIMSLPPVDKSFLSPENR
jgi:hypothetical protein